ncbi:MAG: hydroxylamine reductase [Candidatus Omnitrophica bacterium]|nr:hydroxylamine reductase [Candidatus Omnitrophota bacterium]
MFCRQCEQTAMGKGCTKMGVCGKTAETAALQDLLVYALKGLAVVGKQARENGVRDELADHFLMAGLFATVTNVDFDNARLAALIQEAVAKRERVKSLLQASSTAGKQAEQWPEIAQWNPAGSLEALIGQGAEHGILKDYSAHEDVRSLQELFLYGLKGMAAYADHAWILGEKNEEVTAFFYKGLTALTDTALSADAWVGLVMEQGMVNLKCMEMLDAGHTRHYGHPVPTAVALGVKKGPAIVVSGHDLLDLEMLLQQTDGSGVNIYTHGEMLPAHGYPQLKKYKHLAGHFGTAWQNQQKEFDGVPAAFLFTTNCIQKPQGSYVDRVFTTGMVAWPGVPHIVADRSGKKDFTAVIKKAQALGGLAQDAMRKQIVVGFARQAVLGVADKVVAAVKAGQLKHFFLVGGCDGAKPGRNYYTEFAQNVPQDCAILTLACGKFRFNDQDFGDIGGIPRLLDCGQCNDAYSAIVIASELAKAFNCGVNDLPLSLVLSWYEQKAVCILITLLALGIRNIRIGPSLPAFITPNILKVLVEKFNIMPISTPEADLKAILKK